MKEPQIAKGSNANPSNAISNRTRAYGRGNDMTAITNRAADLVTRYANGRSDTAQRNLERISRAYRNMINRL